MPASPQWVARERAARLLCLVSWQHLGCMSAGLVPQEQRQGPKQPRGWIITSRSQLRRCTMSYAKWVASLSRAVTGLPSSEAPLPSSVLEQDLLGAPRGPSCWPGGEPLQVPRMAALAPVGSAVVHYSANLF